MPDKKVLVIDSVISNDRLLRILQEVKRLSGDVQISILTNRKILDEQIKADYDLINISEMPYGGMKFVSLMRQHKFHYAVIPFDKNAPAYLRFKMLPILCGIKNKLFSEKDNQLLELNRKNFMFFLRLLIGDILNLDTAIIYEFLWLKISGSLNGVIIFFPVLLSSTRWLLIRKVYECKSRKRQ